MSSSQREVWETLLCKQRRKQESRVKQESESTPENKGGVEATEARTEIERDHDRILFSTPVRRLADKTQVFPLDKNDSVRNRLTHSHEVSNLARSLGTTLVYDLKEGEGLNNAQRDIPALLAAVGLVHDLGNPPFGHQGEAAIQGWFRDNYKLVACEDEEVILSDELYQDFLKFEGNAQTFRLVTRLQLLNDNFGLDLTYATLAAMMKYPVGSQQVDTDSTSKSVASKKHGFFKAEEKIAHEVLRKVGLNIGLRHPLAYVMEACDDIAYAVLDIEDAVKKGLASFSDLMEYLKHDGEKDAKEGIEKDEVVLHVHAQACAKHAEYRSANLSPAELNDVSMQRFRVFAIGALVSAAIEAFREHRTTLMDGTEKEALLSLGRAKRLRKLLGNFAFAHAFRHRSVLEIELHGHNTIRGLMDIFWKAIKETNPEKGCHEPAHPYDRYVYSRISENYRRIYSKPTDDVAALPLRYRQCLLLTDMISGMTDSYAMSLLSELRSFRPLNG